MSYVVWKEQPRKKTLKHSGEHGIFVLCSWWVLFASFRQNNNFSLSLNPYMYFLFDKDTPCLHMMNNDSELL